MRKGEQTPVTTKGGLVRSKDAIQLLDQQIINSTNPHISEDMECESFKHFGLFLYIDSTSTPTDLQIEVQFLERWSGKWHTLKQDAFAALYYEDTDTANGLAECLIGLCAGRRLRLKLTGSGTTTSAYFTVSAAIELFN